MLNRRTTLILGASALLSACAGPNPDARSSLERRADETLSRLLRTEPVAQRLIRNAAGVLVFPEIVRGGLVVGGATGRGVLRRAGRTNGYYRSVAVSYGLQAGIAKFGYVAVFMDDASMRFLDNSAGWEVGVGPNVTVADEGFARKLSTTTLRNGVIVFFVDQDGFFAGAGIEGTKITRIKL